MYDTKRPQTVAAVVKEVRSNCYVTLPSVKNQSENMQCSNNLSEINRGLNVLKRPEFTTRPRRKKERKKCAKKKKSIAPFCLYVVDGRKSYLLSRWKETIILRKSRG